MILKQILFIKSLNLIIKIKKKLSHNKICIKNNNNKINLKFHNLILQTYLILPIKINK